MKSRKIYATVLGLFLVAIMHAQQLQKETTASNDPLWFQQASEQIKEMEYGFYAITSNGEFRTMNAANRLRFNIQPDGYSVKAVTLKDASKNWTTHLDILSIAGRSIADKEDFVIIRRKNSLIYQAGPVAIEYSNDEKGLRQNFIVKEKTPGNDALKVQIRIGSDLVVKESANQVVFHSQGDPKDIQLIYDGLKVFDAEGKILAATMELDATTSVLTIQADDSHAVYPVTIDPLNRTPEWMTSADGILPGLLTNLQLQVQTLYGYTVAGLGDINGDGYDDVAVSAPGMADVITGNGTLAGVGAVFVYLGSANGLSATPSKILQPNTAVEGALFGYSVDGGDITGDGKNDIIIGAPLDRYQTQARALIGTMNVNVTAGKVYIYRSEDLFANPDPTAFLQIRLQGATYFSGVFSGLYHSNINNNPLFGFAISVTPDLNNDGKADIIVGSPAYLGIQVLSARSGASFVYYSNNLATTSPTRLNTPTPTLLGLPLLPLANTSGLLFGYSVDGVGDFNNDGHQDVVVGAPAGVDLTPLGGLFSGQVLGGSAFVYFGTGSGIASSIGARLQAEPSGLLSNAANLFGYEVKGVETSMGAKTGRILVGAPVGAVLSNVLGGLRVKAGQVHLFLRKPGASGSYTSDQIISSPRSSSILSILAGQSINVSMLFGSSIDNMFDANCDNIGDIIVGEPLSSNVPLLGANVVGGAAYVYLGNSDGTYNPTPIWDLDVNVSPLLGVNATSLVGYSVAGAGYVKGRNQGVRSLIGGPTNTLDFGVGLLNLGNTVGVLFDFVFDDNGIGKAYSFPYTSCNIILPSSLTNFKGQRFNNASHISWTSVSEHNLQGYDLQRSADGVNYETIATIPGMDQERNDYTFTDEVPFAGMNYYRLKMVDNDASYTYSNIVALNFKEMAGAAVDVVPNPVQRDIHLRMNGMEKGTYRVELVNAAGQRIFTRPIFVTQANQVETIRRDPAIASGMYYLNVYNNNNQRTASIKLIVSAN